MDRLDEEAGKLARRPRLLLEVNVSGEQSKGGFRPDELAASWSSVANAKHVEIAGLMTMAPLDESPQAARPVFSGLRALRDRLSLLEPGPAALGVSQWE